jgi:hypothetical protein
LIKCLTGKGFAASFATKSLNILTVAAAATKAEVNIPVKSDRQQTTPMPASDIGALCRLDVFNRISGVLAHGSNT